MKEKIKEWYEYLKNNYKRVWMTFKENLKEPQYRKKYIVLGLLILVNILIINLLFTFAYYTDDDSIPLLQATVGDFAFLDKDYILYVYIEDANNEGKGSGNYHLTYGIPNVGYKYKSYTCKHNSKLEFNEQTKEVTATLTERDICSIYFNISMPLDLNVRIMLEEAVGSNTYKIYNDVPKSGYAYSHYKCTNGGVVNYDDSSKSLSMSSTKRDYCEAYFKKVG